MRMFEELRLMMLDPKQCHPLPHLWDIQTGESQFCQDNLHSVPRQTTTDTQVQAFFRTSYISSTMETLDETTTLISKVLKEGI